VKTDAAPLTSLSRPRAWEEVAELLRGKILSEELRPGTRLVEATFARQLGISQSTFREALARLAHEGLVLPVPRRGTYVAALPTNTVNHLYELRDSVEPLAMRMAMQNMSDSDKEYLQHQVDRLDSRTPADRIDADMAFHRRLYELTGFLPLQGLWPQMEILTRKILSMSGRLGSVKQTTHNHQAILDALLGSDDAALQRAIQGHMRQTAEIFGERDLAHLDGASPPPSKPNRQQAKLRVVNSARTAPAKTADYRGER
jgi:GntR family transcriptional regulator of gluconate operon